MGSILLSLPLAYAIRAGPDDRSAAYVFLFAVLLTAWLGGLRPGLLAAALGGLLFTYLFVPPVGSLALTHPADALRVAVLAVLGLLVGWLSGRESEARGAADAARIQAQQAAMALRASEARFERLAENARDVVYRYEFTPRPGLTYVNPAVTRILGCSPEEHYANPRLMFELVHPDDLPRLRALMSDPLAMAPVILRWIGKDGQAVWTEHGSVPVYDGTGRLVAVEGIARDITARVVAEEERERARTHALEHERKMAETVHVIAHDVRQPVASALLQASLLAQAVSTGDTAQALWRTETIAQTLRQMNSMVRELVDATRLELGQVALHRETVEMRLLVATVLSGLQATLDVTHVQLDAPEPVLVEADPGQIERVLANLLQNALKHTEPGTDVLVRITEYDERVLVTIADRGPGIPAEDVARIFERGYRSATVQGEPDGLGLGLYIVRLLVEAHGGQIWAESTPGEGTAVYVALPADATQRDSNGAVPARPA